jgi:P pilus assembly chaperone PapD
LLAVGVSPVRVVVPANQSSGVLILQNETDQARTYSIKPYLWTIKEGTGDTEMARTKNIISSIPVIKIPAGETYTSRIMITNRSSAAQDTYRLIIADITPKKPNTEAVDLDLSVKQVSIPVFVYNKDGLKGSISIEKDNRIKNTGELVLRVTQWIDTQGQEQKDLVYLFPGHISTFTVKDLNSVTYTDVMY